MTASTRSLYLDLLKRTILGQVYRDRSVIPVPGGSLYATSHNSGLRAEGKDWPGQAHSMIGEARMDNIFQCVESVLAEDIPGDLVECGVWRGGASIFMRGILKYFGDTDRLVWLYDSFDGLPPPTYPEDVKGGLNFNIHRELAVTVAQVRANFEAYELLDDQVVFVPGWFKDTMPNVDPHRKIAVLRLDGDLYESTYQCLKGLYNLVSVGGFVIVDDWSIPACKQAVVDFLTEEGLPSPPLGLQMIDWTGVYWCKRE